MNEIKGIYGTFQINEVVALTLEEYSNEVDAIGKILKINKCTNEDLLTCEVQIYYLKGVDDQYIAMQYKETVPKNSLVKLSHFKATIEDDIMELEQKINHKKELLKNMGELE